MQWLQTAAVVAALLGSTWALVRVIGTGVYELGRFVARVDQLEKTAAAMHDEIKLLRQYATPRKPE